MLLKQAAINQHTPAQFAALLPAQRTVGPETHASPRVPLQSDAALATSQPVSLEVSLDVPPESQDVLPSSPLESLESMLSKLGNVQAAIKQHTAAQFVAQLPAQRTVEPKTHASPRVGLQSDDAHATAQPTTIEVSPLVVQVTGVAPSRQRTRSEWKRLAEPAELHKAYTPARVVDFEQKKQLKNELAKMVKNMCFVGWGMTMPKQWVLSEEVHEGIMSDAMATVIRTANQQCEVEAQNTRDRVGRLVKAGWETHGPKMALTKTIKQGNVPFRIGANIIRADLLAAQVLPGYGEVSEEDEGVKDGEELNVQPGGRSPLQPTAHTTEPPTIKPFPPNAELCSKVRWSVTEGFWEGYYPNWEGYYPNSKTGKKRKSRWHRVDGRTLKFPKSVVDAAKRSEKHLQYIDRGGDRPCTSILESPAPTLLGSCPPKKIFARSDHHGICGWNAICNLVAEVDLEYAKTLHTTNTKRYGWTKISSLTHTLRIQSKRRFVFQKFKRLNGKEITDYDQLLIQVLALDNRDKLMIVQPFNSNNDAPHVVGVYRGMIFDDSSEHSEPLSMSSLNTACTPYECIGVRCVRYCIPK